MYISHFPKVAKLDLRVEAPLTNVVALKSPGQYIYWDHFYHDLYTNRGFLMGNWVGLDGAGIQASSRYWLNGRYGIQFGYRSTTGRILRRNDSGRLTPDEKGWTLLKLF